MSDGGGYKCVRPMGCFRPSCQAEQRCRMDPKHPRFAESVVYTIDTETTGTNPMTEALAPATEALIKTLMPEPGDFVHVPGISAALKVRGNEPFLAQPSVDADLGTAFTYDTAAMEAEAARLEAEAQRLRRKLQLLRRVRRR